ncbi:MAG: hypothetical protein J0L99_09930 [Chitinophagales bacterium]|nr:hypothetical protein [Chitinophagales bacterium]
MNNEYPPVPELNPEENLRADNELAALNLEMRYGAKVHIEGDTPPEIVQQFLANVAAFEQGHRKGEKTTVYQKIGAPPFAPPDTLEAATLPGELQRVQQLLEAGGFVVIRPDELPDDVFYEFIVTEIFPHETDAFLPPGMIVFLDYDEFHPNEELLIGQITEFFLISLLKLDQPFPEELLSEHCRNEHDPISRDAALASIHAFRDRFQSFVPVAFGLEKLLQLPNGTWQTFGICWEGTPKDGGDKQRHEGLGVMQFGFEEGQWLVQGVQMPGFEF